MNGQRLRATVAGIGTSAAPLPEEVARFDPLRRGESVQPLPMSADDRAEGRRRYEVLVGGWRFEVVVEPHARAELRERAARAAEEHSPQSSLTLRAQIPGRIVRVWVAQGDAVEAGQRLLAVEAMKMENEIRAPRAGVVESVRVDVGALVERHDELITIA